MPTVPAPRNAARRRPQYSQVYGMMRRWESDRLLTRKLTDGVRPWAPRSELDLRGILEPCYPAPSFTLTRLVATLAVTRSPTLVS